MGLLLKNGVVVSTEVWEVMDKQTQALKMETGVAKKLSFRGVRLARALTAMLSNFLLVRYTH